MSPAEYYEEVAILCPSLWPSGPEWDWVNIHDGASLKSNVVDELLSANFGKGQVTVIVHSEVPFALKMSQLQALECISQHVLKSDISVADGTLSKFLSISRNGLATVDA